MLARMHLLGCAKLGQTLVSRPATLRGGRAVAPVTTRVPRALQCRAASTETPVTEGGEANPQNQNKGKNNQKGNNKKGGGGGNRRQKAGSEEGMKVEEIRANRVAKGEALREAGFNPYAYRFDATATCAQLQEKYAHLEPGEEVELEGDAMEAVRGRITARRVMGKLAFVGLSDETGSIQLYVEKNKVNQSYEEAFAHMNQLVDVGDIVGARGSIKKTEKGELSVNIASFEVLTKSILPLPDKYHGLKDIEMRYRQRYLDLIVNPEVRDTLRTRSRIISLIRRHLEDKAFIEVETPVLETCAGGAEARPFITYHNSLERTMTLRIATELHLKRMVVGGFERVFEIGRIFRNEGISTRHNPEFTSVELYQAYADINDMLALTESIIVNCLEDVCGKLVIDYQDTKIDFTPPFRRASMNDLVHETTGVDFSSFDKTDLEGAKAAAIQALKDAKCPTGKIATCPSIGHVLNEVFEETVEQTLINPTFVLDHPIEISPLAKPHRSKEGTAERFELFIATRELANSFSELTDPIEQRQRLEAQIANHTATGGGKEGADDLGYEVKVDEDFLTALEYGMPPTGGMQAEQPKAELSQSRGMTAAELTEAVAAQGSKVRELKSSEDASKEEIKAQVDELLALKARLAAAEEAEG